MIKLSKYMSPNCVLFSDAQSRDKVLSELVDALFKEGQLPNRDEFYKAINDREKIVSTGIGIGVAIPHAKLTTYKDFFIAIAILHKGIEWKALDDVPVRLIFMIGGPEEQPTKYLQILSKLTTIIRDEETRKKVLTLNSKEAIIKLFE